MLAALDAAGGQGHLEKVEKVMRDFTRRIPELRELSYQERLAKLKMNSQQRRMER